MVKMRYYLLASLLLFLTTACTHTPSAPANPDSAPNAQGEFTAEDRLRWAAHKQRMQQAGIQTLNRSSIDHYMHRQASELQDALKDSGLVVSRRGDALVVTLPGNLALTRIRDDIAPQIMPTLDKLAAIIKRHPQTVVEVTGHTDGLGSQTHNEKLSIKQAQLIADYLKQQAVPAIQVETVGYGESRPVDNNMTAEGREKNRRVEIILLPLTSSQAATNLADTAP